MGELGHRDKNKKFYLFLLTIINIIKHMKITHALVVKLVDTKDLKSAACGVPVRVWRTPQMSKLQIISDKNKINKN